MDILKALNWRYATKKMSGKKVPAEKLETILEAARLAPSSAGFQPYSIIVINDPETLAKIQPIAFNQPQISQASELLVFAAWDDMTPARINAFFDHTEAERGLSPHTMDEFRNRMLGMFGAKTQEENFQHAARQTYIAFGIAIAAAASLEVDATPMEGFDNAKMDEFLGLKEKGLKSVTILPIGYRDETSDWLVNLKKVRKPKAELVHHFN